MITFSEFKNPHSDTITFTVANASSSFVNALRRTIITDVQTVSFNVDDYENSDLKVIKNTSSVHNEFILHRLGLLPINFKGVPKYNPDNYKFVLNVTNKSSKTLNVTSKDIKVINIQTNKEEDSSIFFPPNPITNDYILLLRLKPNMSEKEGESIHIEGKSSRGSGDQHIRFSPVSCIMFTNKRDTDKVNVELSNYVKEVENSRGQTIDKSELPAIAKTFDLEYADRYFFTDENGDPNVFDFNIESCGILKPHTILTEGIVKLINKLKNFMLNLNKSLSDQDSSVEIRESTSVMKAFDITIENESHTLGFLIQTYINKLFKNENIFVGYMNPHPLQKKIMLRINVNSNDINEVKRVVDTTVNQLLNNLKILKTEVDRVYEPKKKFVVKKNKKATGEMEVMDEVLGDI